jgi:hypothetical protein
MRHSQAAEVIFMASSMALNLPPAVGLEGGHISRRNMAVLCLNVLYVGRETPAPAGQACIHIDTTKVAALDLLSFMPSLYCVQAIAGLQISPQMFKMNKYSCSYFQFACDSIAIPNS